MEVRNCLSPTKDQMRGFNEGDIDTPIFMLNLLKFKEKADYEDGRKSNLSGADAYDIYIQKLGVQLERVGATVVFTGQVSRLMLGEVEELWDKVVLVRYPNRQAMLKMVTNPEYSEVNKHRTAGLAGQLNIETKEHPHLNQ